jgi:ribulose kinase
MALLLATVLPAMFGAVACGGTAEDAQKQADEQVQQVQQYVDKQLQDASEQVQQVSNQAEQKALGANDQVQKETQDVKERLEQEVGNER